MFYLAQDPGRIYGIQIDLFLFVNEFYLLHLAHEKDTCLQYIWLSYLLWVLVIILDQPWCRLKTF